MHVIIGVQRDRPSFGALDTALSVLPRCVCKVRRRIVNIALIGGEQAFPHHRWMSPLEPSEALL